MTPYRAAEVSSPPPAAEPYDPVTYLPPRERDVLQAMAGGLNVPEMARRWHASQGTVRGWQQSLYKRLGVNTGPHAVAVAFRRGILAADPDVMAAVVPWPADADQGDPMTGIDKLPPTQYLILDVLAARCRLGEQLWPFPTSVRWSLLALADAGLIDVMSGNVERTMRARLTDVGRAAVLSGSYSPPIVSEIADAVEAEALRMRREDFRSGRVGIQYIVLLLLAAFGINAGRVAFGWLGLALIAFTALLLPHLG